MFCPAVIEKPTNVRDASDLHTGMFGLDLGWSLRASLLTATGGSSLLLDASKPPFTTVRKGVETRRWNTGSNASFSVRPTTDGIRHG